MKLTKEELLQKINDADISNELKVELMEDISDSLEIENVDLSGYVEKEKYDELLEKYKSRFLEGSAKEEPEKEEVEELKEEEVIDVKEI